MNRAFVFSLTVLLASGAAHADPEADLKFAQRLVARGLKDMALKVLTDLENSSDAQARRAGSFGKAQITKFEADRARAFYMRDINAGEQLRFTREQVDALYKEARPKIKEYVENRPDNLDAKFLYANLLQEYAEFLSGADLPDDMAEQRAKLVSDHKDECSKLFQEAIKNYEDVRNALKGKVGKNTPLDDPVYVQLTLAGFNRGLARFRWALIFPKGPNFQHRVDEAIEVLDDFLQAHFDEAVGAYAMIYLGRAYYEKALRMGDANEGEVAIDYFDNVINTVKEDPNFPETFNIVGTAVYWYARTCNALAKAEGNLKKAQPIFFQNTLKAGTTIRTKLKHGAKHPMAMKALLEVADAHAAQRNFDAAVGLAGEVLATARVEGEGSITKLATGKLTNWVASVRGAGALDPNLLFQIGASLGQQGRIGNAVTFYEKALAASKTDEEKEKVAYPAALEIAKLYNRDKRYFAAAMVAWNLVQDFLKTGEDSDSDLGLTAGEACNQARIAWRAIASATNDQSKYQEVKDTFRQKFPEHPENSDAAYGAAMELFSNRQFEEAAEKLKEINPASPNYWRAQRRVPQCYRVLAQQEKDEAKSKAWHERCLAAAAEVAKGAAGKADEAAKRAEQYARLYLAMSESALGKHDDALKSIDSYLAKYTGKFIRRGMSLRIKIDAHIARADALAVKGQTEEAQAELAKAEEAFKQLLEKAPASPFIPQAIIDLYTALRTAYKAIGTGDVRRAMATRTANLWSQHLERQGEEQLTATHYFAFGDALRDAGQWNEAGDAFASAANMSEDEQRRAYFNLQAAEMKFRAAKEGLAKNEISKKDYVKIMQETRQLFTDVIIPEKNQQKAVLKELANWQKPPRKALTGHIKRRPRILLTTADVFHESNAGGNDGRWIAIRLLDHLQRFTVATVDETKPSLTPLIPVWWDAAELKLKIYQSIASSGGDQQARVAKQRGHGFAKKLLFSYTKMDGPERVKRIEALERVLR